MKQVPKQAFTRVGGRFPVPVAQMQQVPNSHLRTVHQRVSCMLRIPRAALGGSQFGSAAACIELGRGAARYNRTADDSVIDDSKERVAPFCRCSKSSSPKAISASARNICNGRSWIRRNHGGLAQRRRHAEPRLAAKAPTFSCKRFRYDADIDPYRIKYRSTGFVSAVAGSR